MGTIFGCSSLPVIWASFTKRRTASRESAIDRRRLTATKRCRSRSQARTTSPMPPAPKACRYSYFSGAVMGWSWPLPACRPRLNKTELVRCVRTVGADSGCLSAPGPSRTVVLSMSGSNADGPLNSIRTVFSSEQEQATSSLEPSAAYRPPHFVHLRII